MIGIGLVVLLCMDHSWYDTVSKLNYRPLPYAEVMRNEILGYSSSGPALDYYTSEWGIDRLKAGLRMDLGNYSPLRRKRVSILPGPEYRVFDGPCYTCSRGKHELCISSIGYSGLHTHRLVASGKCTCCVAE